MEDIKNRWRSYFKKLLNPSDSTGLDNNIDKAMENESNVIPPSYDEDELVL